MGVYKGNIIVTDIKALSAASEALAAGIYEGTTLSAVDADLAAANIKKDVVIFGITGTFSTEAAHPITAGKLPTGDIGFVNGAKITGSGTQTLSDANSTVNAGYYEATTLEAVDTDLVVGNIKTGVTIFGKAGTFTADAATKSTGTLTSNGTNVADGDTVLVDAKTYTFKTALTPAEGEVLIGADAAESLDNLKLAINRTEPGTNDGVKYKIAAAHPTVEATTNTDTVQTVQALTAGVAGNTIDLATTNGGAGTITRSGEHMAGGTEPATATQLAAGYFAWVNGVKITGT
jgi:hypothetical protein